MELDQEKGLEMRKWVLSGILASEETYLSHLQALLIVRVTYNTQICSIICHITDEDMLNGMFLQRLFIEPDCINL